ncbi:P-loop NTPase [Actinoplanes sp. KI2]|uniref:AAA family ATPase n=1 Tax=Actinoplanes sp. KI2 TaxID=2983315 RepID=UPI0021D5BF2D|nr:P-loop NTPase [Actinoplanes sp. KI2]MCU7728347.1 P-loop NTPase [Actinoplanes sp. KI2]
MTALVMTMTIYCDPSAAFPGSAQPACAVPDPAQLPAAVAASPDAQLVVLGAGVPLDEAVRFAARQRVERPALGVLLLRESVEVDVLAEAMRAGIREVVPAGDPAAVDAACARSVALSRQLTAVPAAAGEHTTQVLTVFAGKGGVGKSTVAANLAVTLADNGRRRVCLVDLDLQFGDVGIMLQLPPERTLADAVGMAGRLDEDGVRSLITPYRDGIDVLLAPSGPAEGDQVGRELVAELLGVLAPMYDYVVVDTPPYVSDQVLAALDRTDWFVLVVTPDLPALKSVRLTLTTFEMLQYPAERRLVLLNRADSEVGLTVADVEKAIGQPTSVLMPSSRDVPLSVNRGVPLAIERPGHPVAKAMRELAAKCGAPDSGRGRRHRSLLFGRRH